ncbi:hypothetical protein [Shewanella sp.]|uniref:hypothetical protein n=1 Tax=Shewanella sp. TaxID=50422 RepID=UPI0040485DBC
MRSIFYLITPKFNSELKAVGFLLVWCGRSATTLVAAGHKEQNTMTPAQKHCRNDEKGFHGLSPNESAAG